MRAMLWDDWRVRFVVQILAVFCFSPAVFGQATGRSSSPTNVISLASTSAQPIFELSLFLLSITAAIFVVVFALLAYSVVRFRKRREDDRLEPPQVYGSNQVGLAWTLIPILIVVTLFWQQRE
jgi:cytochrome c oxidase subunit II